jgi:endonuclease G
MYFRLSGKRHKAKYPKVMKNMKRNLYVLLFASIVVSSSCRKDDPTFNAINPPVVVNPVTPPVTSADSNLVMGNPSNATDNAANYSNYLIKEGYYSLSYNRDRGIPNWVSWHVVSSDSGNTPRQDDFRSNPRLPSGWYRVDNLSYSSSGFDRGHMCPSGDRTVSVPANSSTFLMTNMVPQAPYNNQVTWAGLENYTRSLMSQGKELYVISGAYGEGGSAVSSGITNTIDNSRVTVPAKLWKVIVVLNNGSDDLNRVTTTTRVITIVLPNINTVNADWKTYRVSVDFLEQETGYDLLSNVPVNIQSIIEAQVDTL